MSRCVQEHYIRCVFNVGNRFGDPSGAFVEFCGLFHTVCRSPYAPGPMETPETAGMRTIHEIGSHAAAGFPVSVNPLRRSHLLQSLPITPRGVSVSVSRQGDAYAAAAHSFRHRLPPQGILQPASRRCGRETSGWPRRDFDFGLPRPSAVRPRRGVPRAAIHRRRARTGLPGGRRVDIHARIQLQLSGNAEEPAGLAVPPAGPDVPG